VPDVLARAAISARRPRDRHEDGTIERWRQPELPTWEVPKRNPHERRPRAPDWEPEAAAAKIAKLSAAAEAA
jgi:hypothetical protein